MAAVSRLGMGAAHMPLWRIAAAALACLSYVTHAHRPNLLMLITGDTSLQQRYSCPQAFVQEVHDILGGKLDPTKLERIRNLQAVLEQHQRNRHRC